MTNSKKKVSALSPSSVHASSVTSLLGPPSILASESLARYYALETDVIASIEMKGAFDKIMVRNCTDITWEIIRYKTAITRLIEVAAKRAIDSLMEKLGHSIEDGGRYSENYFEDEEARQTVLDILEKYGLDEESLTAEAIRLSMDEVQPLNKLVEGLEYRLHTVLREYDRRTHMAILRLAATDTKLIEGVAMPRTAIGSTPLAKPAE